MRQCKSEFLILGNSFATFCMNMTFIYITSVSMVYVWQHLLSVVTQKCYQRIGILQCTLVSSKLFANQGNLDVDAEHISTQKSVIKVWQSVQLQVQVLSPTHSLNKY